MATNLYARADWDSAKIEGGDIAPFVDVSGLAFGVNAFNSAAAITALSGTNNAQFAACGDSESYGDMSCNGFYNLTVSTVEYNGKNSACFGRLSNEWGGYTVVFNGATAGFKRADSDTSTSPVFYIAATNASVKIENKSAITISPNETNETLLSISGSFSLSNSSLKLIGDTSAAVSSATMEIKDGATFEAGSFKSIYPSSTTISGSGTKFTVKGEFENGGTLAVSSGAEFTANTVTNQDTRHIEISGAAFNANTIDNKSLISITSDPVNGTPSDVSVGHIVFAAGPSPKLEMDWKSTMNFTEITGALDHVRIIINLEGIELSSEQKILDFQGTGTAPTEAYYKQLLGEDAWNAAASSPFLAGFAVVDGDLIIKKTYGTVYVQENGNDDPATATPEAPYFATVAGAAAVTPAEIIVRDYSEDSAPLTVADASYFNGFKAQIGESTTSGESITFSKNLYAGSKYTGNTSATAYIVNPLTINCGSMRFVSGGSLVSMDSNSNTVTFKGSTELIINGGSFAVMTAGAGKATMGTFSQNGNVNVTINGGQFDAGFCCGVAHSVNGTNAGDAASTITGDLLLTIKGGSFKSGTWIYGGSASSKKENNYSVRNTIDGNTCITIDGGSGNSIQLSNVVAGSHGYGVINGNTQLVFKGSGANLTISGQLWGGCSGDTYAIDENDPAFRSVLQTTAVTGKRILSFDGFNGALNCTKIRCFNTFEARNGSAVTLAKTAYDLSEIENWSFEYGSSLTNSNFDNDFSGDNLDLDLTGWNQSSPWTVMENIHENAFAGFNSFHSVTLGGEEAAYSNEINAWVSASYKLQRSGQSMVFSASIA